MRILFLAPQPFFQERGTPIAVRLAVEVLAKRAGDQVDLLTYHEGEDVALPGVRLHRIHVGKWGERLGLKRIGPGISCKKLICDVFFLFRSLALVKSSLALNVNSGSEKEQGPYHLVHAVEESVFIAWLIKRLWGIPYLYDMDSSLALQLAEKWWWVKPLAPLLSWLERLAVRESLAVVPVCDALAAIAQRHGSRHTKVLSDISLLGIERGDAARNKSEGEKINLRAEMGVPSDAKVLLYIGNLERYQGIDLLIESFSSIAKDFPEAHLAVIGGSAAHIEAYRTKSALLAKRQIHILGPRPVAQLNEYLAEASILVSPRTLGNNTPMKIFSYLHSGIPVLATRLPTHTQVLTPDVSVLAAPSIGEFGAGMATLLADAEMRASIGARARALAESRYTFAQFEQTLSSIYDTVRQSVGETPLRPGGSLVVGG
jgi:glycosyltransferase involved in cell wall biosynthesis